MTSSGRLKIYYINVLQLIKLHFITFQLQTELYGYCYDFLEIQPVSSSIKIFCVDVMYIFLINNDLCNILLVL